MTGTTTKRVGSGSKVKGGEGGGEWLNGARPRRANEMENLHFSTIRGRKWGLNGESPISYHLGPALRAMQN